MSFTYITAITQNQTQPQTKENNTKTIQDVYLRYLIDEETKFANIDRIETYYKEAIVQKYIKYNDNHLKIHNKRIEYDKITTDLVTEAIENYVFPPETFLKYYNDQIESIYKEIQIRLHDIERYNHMYNRLYHTHYMIKKRIETEQKYISINQKQYSKYIEIKQLAENDNNKQIETLTHMNKYQQKISEIKDANLNKKTNKIVRLENEVKAIKSTTLKMNEKIKVIKAAISNSKQELIVRQKRNYYDLNIYVSRKTYFFRLIVQLVSKLKLFQVKHPNDLIAKINKIKEKISVLYSNFNHVNIEIKKLNSEYRKYELKLNNYYDQIRENNVYFLPNISSCKILYLIQTTKSSVSDLQKSYNQKEFLFQMVFMFIIENNRKLFRKMKDNKYTNNSKVLQLILNENNIKLNHIAYNYEFIQFTCKLLLFFFNCLWYNMFMSFDQITSGDLLYIVNSDRKKMIIASLFSKEYLVLFKELTGKASSNVKAKLKYIKKNEENLLENLYRMKNSNDLHAKVNIFNSGGSSNNNNTKPHKSKNLKKTQKELFNSFRNHIEKKKQIDNSMNDLMNLFTNRSYFENHPRKIMSILGKYQNDLVVKEDYMRHHLYSSSASQSRFTSKTRLVKKIYSKDKYQCTKSTNDNWCDSYENSQKESVNEKGRRKLIKSFYVNNSGDEQMAKIYRRLNDLRSLKLKYNENSGPNSNELIELFKSFKSKVRNNSHKNIHENKRKSSKALSQKIYSANNLKQV